MSDRDDSQPLSDAVREAWDKRQPLYIRGNSSKRRMFGRACHAQPLDVAQHRGIVSYRPEELMITARAGTPIAELVAATSAHRQCLPFEPASFEGTATLGGTLACGLSGPARPWRGSVRDSVLGIRLINGLGEQLRFGGEVIKNVAGYDVARLQAGALGTLGLITEVSLKLLPQAADQLCLQREAAPADALEEMRAIARRPYPLTGACWLGGLLHLRFAGSTAALREVRRQLDGFAVAGDPPWQALREWQLPGLTPTDRFLGVDLAPATALAPASNPALIDWGGARRFSSEAASADIDINSTGNQLGQFTRYGGGEAEDDAVATPVATMQALQRRIKEALDPHGVFNPGRLHRWL